MISCVDKALARDFLHATGQANHVAQTMLAAHQHQLIISLLHDVTFNLHKISYNICSTLESNVKEFSEYFCTFEKDVPTIIKTDKQKEA